VLAVAHRDDELVLAPVPCARALALGRSHDAAPVVERDALSVVLVAPAEPDRGSARAVDKRAFKEPLYQQFAVMVMPFEAANAK
jgi:hypothetical protein